MSDPSPSTPLFYAAPEAVTAERFGSHCLRTGDYRFAASAAFVPLVLSEFGPAARHYPILFTDHETVPVALLGVEQRNLFVEDGAWATDAHIPAYVRRYPFGSCELGETGRFTLIIDGASDLLVEGDEGEALFAQGRPTRLTANAFAFCEAFRDDAAATRQYCDALLGADLLVERRAQIVLPDGESLGVNGFKVVDFDRFRALDADRVVEWHRKGWLALAQFHLASLDRFASLVARTEGRRADAGAVADAERALQTTTN